MSPSRLAVGRLLTSYACASVAIGLPWPLLTARVWEEHGAAPHGALLVGLAAAARMLPYVALSWAVGSLGDRWRRDRLVQLTLLLRWVLLVAAAGALLQDSVLAAVVAASLAVAVGTPAYPAMAAALPRLAGPDRGPATRLLVTVEVSAWVVGPAIGGLLLTPAARAWTLPLAAVLAGVGALLARGMWLPGPAATDGPGALGDLGNARAPIRGMLREVARRRRVVGALATAALLNLVLGAAALVLLPLTHDVWGQGEGTAAGFGAATAWLGFGALGAPLLGWVTRRLPGDRRGQALAVLAGVFVLVALTPVPVAAMPLLALGGACAVVVEASATEVVQQVPDHHRAGALGLTDTVMVGAALVGSLAGPALAAAVGARGALLLLAVAAVVPAVRAVVARRAARPSARASARPSARPRTAPTPAPTMLACRPTAIPSARPVASGSPTAGGTPPTAWPW